MMSFGDYEPESLSVRVMPGASPFPSTEGLEFQFQPKLNNSSIRCADDLSEPRSDRYAGHSEVRVVKRVEKLHPELSG